VLKSGVPNAIRAFKEVLLPRGIRHFGIRLDSGDMAYLSKCARKMLDDEGLTECKIYASNSLDEYTIRDLIRQGAQIDTFGVGERLITAKSDAVFGGVYKLAAAEEADGTLQPRIKISETSAKITNPHFKKVYRLFDRESGMALADQICVYDEQIDDTRPLVIFDQHETWKRKTIKNFVAKELLVPVFRNGEQVYEVPNIVDTRAYCADCVAHLWDEVKRFDNPHTYYVDLSQKLYNIKQAMLSAYAQKNENQ
jgi:nicotinate phosphoribosyltransferase